MYKELIVSNCRSREELVLQMSATNTFVVVVDPKKEHWFGYIAHICTRSYFDKFGYQPKFTQNPQFAYSIKCDFIKNPTVGFLWFLKITVYLRHRISAETSTAG